MSSESAPFISRFGQKLAHSEKPIRDRALKSLKRFLKNKSEWTDLDLDKIWKALFYCMWMSDKPKVQDELSTNLANLLHNFKSGECELRFVESFFRTIHREWHGIDGLRLDKFYALIRKIVHQSFVLLNETKQMNLVAVQTFADLLWREIVSKLPNGLRLHITDLYLEELHKAIGETVSDAVFITLLQPFFNLLHTENDKVTLKRVRNLIFKAVLEQYVFGEATSDEVDDEVLRFPNVKLSSIQLHIFKIASADNTPEKNRSVLYDLYKKFHAVTHVDSAKELASLEIEVSKGKDEEDGKIDEKPHTKKRKVEDITASTSDTANNVETVSNPTKKKKKKTKAKINNTNAADTISEEGSKLLSEKQNAGTAKNMVAETIASKINKDSHPTINEVEEVITPVKKKKVKKNINSTKQESVKIPNSSKVRSPETKTGNALKDSTEETLVHKSRKSIKSSISETVEKTESNELKSIEDKTENILQDTVKETPKSKKKKRKQKSVESEKNDDDLPATASKKLKNNIVKEVKDVAPTRTPNNTPVKVLSSKKSKKSSEVALEKSTPKKDMTVTYPKCKSCGGFGKGLVTESKPMCNHCTRMAKLNTPKKSKHKSPKKVIESEELFTTPKKVSFGKNKSLPYVESIKRLKASTKKKQPDEKKAPRSLLKTESSYQTPELKKKKKKVHQTTGKLKNSSSKKRMKASDFF